jgi:hypothetical protein
MRKTKRALQCDIQILVTGSAPNLIPGVRIIEQHSQNASKKKENTAVQCDVHPLYTERTRGFAGV